MKSILFILLFVQVSLSGQINEHIHWPMTIDAKSFEDLQDSNLIVDKVWFYKSKIYSKRQLSPKLHEEYIKINDTIYYYKKSSFNNILEKGYLKIDKSKIFKADTMTIFCDNDSYEETIQIQYWHEPIKTARWTYYQNDSTSFEGNYVNGKKNDIWTKRKSEIKKSVNYSMNEIVGFYNPSTKEIQNNISWLLKGEFYIFSSHLFNDGKIQTRFLENLNAENKCNSDCLRLKFLTENIVEIQHTKERTIYSENLNGSYNYKIDKESNLTIDFKEYGVYIAKINYFDKERIRLIDRKITPHNKRR